MPAFLLSWLLGLGANAIALVLSSLIFGGFNLHFSGFIWALLIFAVLSAFLPWLLAKVVGRYAPGLMALTGLVSTFLALLVTTLLSSGLSIDGVSTWVMATLFIWVISLVIWVIPGPWRNQRKARELKGR
ncbi:MAG: hypothetical protein RJB01_731 [Actinomycetota bacterium]|jgi:uncharacterized membrane protein YvlD (DUF360 family)